MEIELVHYLSIFNYVSAFKNKNKPHDPPASTSPVLGL